MTDRSFHPPIWRRRALLSGAAILCLLAAIELPAAVLLSAPALAEDGGEGGEGGGGNGGGNGNGNGNDGGNDGGDGGGSNDGGGDSGGGDGGDGDGDGGDSDGGGNDGGDDGGSGSGSTGAGGDDSGGSGSNSGSGESGENPGDDQDEALNLRERGEIRPLGDVYAVAERQLQGKVIAAELVAGTGKAKGRWAYDLRVVTQDGRVRRVRYDAATLALLSVDGQVVE